MAIGGWTGCQPAHLQLYKEERCWGLTRAARSGKESWKSTQTRFPSQIEAPWQGFQMWKGVEVGSLQSAGSTRVIEIKKDFTPAPGSCKGRDPHARVSRGSSWTKGRPVLHQPGLVQHIVLVHEAVLGFTSQQSASPGRACQTGFYHEHSRHLTFSF